jgi:CubicO group peptidase (beta-lactamase class C family)
MQRPSARVALLFASLLLGCHASACSCATPSGNLGGPRRAPTSNLPPPAPLPPLGVEASASFGESTPSREGIDPNSLMALADWVEDSDVPIFSILISRHGKLVFELYTSRLTREHAHYLMSVTKSFTSALVGIALDRKLLLGTDESVDAMFPRELFASDADVERFKAVTLKDVLAMSALDAQVPPHRTLPEDKERQANFLASANRARFALTQKLLPEPGTSFQYTDITPLIATGALSYASKQSAFDFAQANLFGPLGFRNAEWMHEDKSGIDNGAYGLRARPIDLQKFGVLFLRGGEWNGKQVISRAWVEQSFTPWIRSGKQAKEPNYGWYWWLDNFFGETAHSAHGWKGQRITVVPKEELVVTMTGAIEGGDEQKIFATVMNEFVMPAVHPRFPEEPAVDGALRAKLELVRANVDWITDALEKRMVPSIEAKERHHPFEPR